MRKKDQHRGPRSTTEPGSLSILLLLSLLVLWPGTAQAQVIEIFDEDEVADSDEPMIIGDEDAPPLLIDRSGTGTGIGRGHQTAIRIEYERRGSSILVPARIGSHDAYFVFDTGATYTTLTSDFAATAGATPPRDAPTTVVQTAGGLRQTSFGLIRSLHFGRRIHRNVTFTVCDACGFGFFQGKPVVGLLGLNVLRRYRVSVDDSAGLIELTPHSAHDDQSADIEPWLAMQLEGIQPQSTRTELTMRIENKSPQDIRSLTLEVECITASGERRPTRSPSTSIRSRQNSPLSLSVDTTDCVDLEPRIVEASW